MCSVSIITAIKVQTYVAMCIKVFSDFTIGKYSMWWKYDDNMVIKWWQIRTRLLENELKFVNLFLVTPIFFFILLFRNVYSSYLPIFALVVFLAGYELESLPDWRKIVIKRKKVKRARSLLLPDVLSIFRNPHIFELQTSNVSFLTFPIHFSPHLILNWWLSI